LEVERKMSVKNYLMEEWRKSSTNYLEVERKMSWRKTANWMMSWMV
jgi:hypothetical protein